MLGDFNREQIQKEFDQIAVLSQHEPDCAGTYDSFLLESIPQSCDRALEIGCGTGAFTRLLARRFTHVTATDRSSEMIRVARARSTGFSNIEYVAGDGLALALPPAHFDCIVMIATLHHLPNGTLFEKLKQALKPRGVLIFHDLLAPAGLFDRAADLLRFPLSMIMGYRRTRRLWARREVRRAWAAHGKEEQFLTKPEVAALRDQHLPGGSVKYHLLWRYTVVWHKQGEA